MPEVSTITPQENLTLSAAKGENMNWEKVVQKLRAAADQHAKNAQNELLRGNKNMMEAEHRLSEIFYGLHAALEAGLEPDTR